VQGFALVPPEGSLGGASEPAAAVVLTEGGQLMVHDLRSLQPLPLSLPFQELPTVTASLFLPGPVSGCCFMLQRHHIYPFTTLRDSACQRSSVMASSGALLAAAWAMHG
jgi:hypothetical protein